MKLRLFFSLLLASWLALMENNTIFVNGEEGEAAWQSCEIFLAPSSVPGGGWGVYAGRNFETNEVVELSPLFIPFHDDAPLILNSVVNDYHFGYIQWNETTQSTESITAINFGMVLFYNHHPEPNLNWASFGHEHKQFYGRTKATGFTATRKIKAGEELFCSYGLHDGGKEWFQGRQLTQQVAADSRKTGTTYIRAKHNHCSKIYAGIGRPTWNNRVMLAYDNPDTEDESVPDFIMDEDRLAPLDHPTAITKKAVVRGDILETAPALVVSAKYVRNTPMGAFAVFWQNLHVRQKMVMRELRRSGDWRLQFQDDSTGWERVDAFHGDDFEDIVVLPVAGSIGLVRRMSSGDVANCRLIIMATSSMEQSDGDHLEGSTGILLQLVALRDMGVGEELVLSLPDPSNPYERYLVRRALEKTGQPAIPHFSPIATQRMQDEL